MKAMLKMRKTAVRAACLAVVLASCGTTNNAAAQGDRVAEQTAAQQPVLSDTLEAAPESNTLTLIAAGDNLYHDVMIRPSDKKNNAYNFDTYYAFVKPLIENADIAFVNQETVLGGERFGFSGYPQFNTPQEAGDALVAAGFDVISHATNHIMDKGEAAVFAAMDFWDARPDIKYLGIHRKPEQRDKQIIIEKNNIKIGFLAYTYGTNGLPVPKDKPYLVSLIDTAVMAKEIDALRPNCDFLIVAMHWGNEYEHTYSAQQKRLAEFLAEHRVDLVIGHHPHVLQPVETISRSDGGTMLCVYSLGNFISAQTEWPRLLGGLLYLGIKKSVADSKITIEKAGVIPVVTHYETGHTNFRIYPLSDYTDELAKKHGNNRQGKEISIPRFKTLARDVLGASLIDEDVLP
ncbi:capsular polysaccharide biosynthesis protein [Spirochaetia bacterium]|nr:capsular polysaccharide biosynthesis protein [Spirochaetia bacterium]